MEKSLPSSQESDNKFNSYDLLYMLGLVYIFSN